MTGKNSNSLGSKCKLLYKHLLKIMLKEKYSKNVYNNKTQKQKIKTEIQNIFKSKNKTNKKKKNN